MSENPRPGSLAARLTDRPTVLVVEDEADIAEFLGAYFRASGLALEHLDPTTVDEVSRAVEDHAPSCVLLDLHLRGLSGLDVYRRLRADPVNALLPVVIVTADGRASVRDEAVRGGVDAFVTKPFNVKALFGLVQERMAAAQLRAAVTTSPASGDTVTNVGTHTYVHDRLADELGLAAHTGRPVAFALVRLLSLKAVNTQVGFAAGDVVLRQVATRLQAEAPGAAVVGRNAGAEFAVVLPGLDARAAGAALEAATANASRPVELPGGGVADVSLAVGLAAYPDHGATRDELYMAADVALTEACEQGLALQIAR